MRFECSDLRQTIVSFWVKGRSGAEVVAFCLLLLLLLLLLCFVFCNSVPADCNGVLH